MARRSYFRIVALLAVLALCTAGTLAFRGVGHWLVCEDPLAPEAVIVVLAGAMPSRAEEAARIYRLGAAPEVWVTRPVSPSGELAAMGIQYFGEDYFSREVLAHSGVPEHSVRVLPEPVVDTQEEVRAIAAEMQRQGKPGVIIVTSPQHTRRVKLLWRKLVGDSPRAIVRAAREDSFDDGHWWRSTQDSLAVARELMGLANAWAGFPVKPRSR